MRFKHADNLPTVAAISVIAYLSADLAHHALGHAAACYAMHGAVERLSSVYVQCTRSHSVIDLAGPLANLVVGGAALLGLARLNRGPAPIRLLFTLIAAFNLFWVALQLAFSAASKTDDWAWAMQEYRLPEWGRYGLMLLGIGAYLSAIRIIGRRLAPFADPLARVRIITSVAWIAAGVTAIATAAFGPDALAVILRHAAPQSLLLSIGLLWTPAGAVRALPSEHPAAALRFSLPWVAVAALLGGLSLALLGPGIGLAR